MENDLLRTLVTVAALMKTERPVRHLRRCPYNLRILLTDGGGITGTASKEVEVKHSANNVVLQRPIGKFDIHAVRIE